MSRSLNRPGADRITTPELPEVDSSPDELAPVTVDEAPGRLPDGVQMHDAGVLPVLPVEGTDLVPDPKAPPKGWKGSFSRCGGCGDFIGNEPVCPRCAPGAVPSNVSMSGLPRVLA